MTSDTSSIQLPFEVLGEIFGHLISGEYGTLELFAVLLVSRSWNTATMQHPRLWTGIKLDMWFYAYFYERGALVAASFVRSCLERSAVLHFDLVLHFDHLSHDPKFVAYKRVEREVWTYRAAGQARHVLNVLSGYMPRCNSLEWHLGRPVEDVLSYFPTTLDQLKFLSVDRCDAYMGCPGTISCPALEYVSYTNRPYHFVLSERVKVLELRKTFCWVDADLAPISDWSGSVRILKLYCAARGSNPAQFRRLNEEPNGLIVLANLEILEIEGLVPRGLLVILRAPTLRHLCIRSDEAYGVHSMAEVVSTLVHKSARTLLVELNNRAAIGWEPIYNNLVVDMPNLEDANVVVKEDLKYIGSGISPQDGYYYRAW